MKGLELSRKYYEAYGVSMLESQFPEVLPYLAIGLVGGGSECFGFDDEISRDHDFEPGFCVFLPEEDIVDSRTAFQLERAYAKLPKEFMGYHRNALHPVGGNRHGVIRVGDFFESKVGSRNGQLTTQGWLSIPEYALAEAVNGEIFSDPYGLFTKIREDLKRMPEDIRLKKLAGHLLLMGQSGQYNYMRCMERQETGAAQLSVVEFTKSAMQVVFLLNQTYMPYYKWSFRALRELPLLSELSDTLEYFISSGNGQTESLDKYRRMEDVCKVITDELHRQGLTTYSGSELEGQAYAVNACIKDGDIRNCHVLCAV